MFNTTSNISQSFETLQTRLDDVRERIAASARRSQRQPEEITLIAVSKTHPVGILQQALEAGVRDFGENRVQEAESKIEEIKQSRNGSVARWHLIGHLQANKAKRAIRFFDIIHSVDSLELVERLNRLCIEQDRAELPVLVQVDLAGEASKSGALETDLPQLAQAINDSERLRLKGLMTLPPFFEDSEHARPYFRRLRELRDGLRANAYFGEEDGWLSMGMSNDYEVAIEEGATMVRVGSAIFGERSKFVDTDSLT